nr:phospholipid carrier-dependent glycosyltransferase [uncultured Pseudomonas sp.]
MLNRKLSLFLIVAVLLFVGLGNHQLQNSTEPRVAGIAMEMHLSDNWVTPTLNGEPFLEKPPLSVWLNASMIRIWGGSPSTVRLASAFAGLFCILLLYSALTRSRRPKEVVWCAAFMLATTASFWANSRQVGEDALLTLGVTMALLKYYQTLNRGPSGSTPIATWLLYTLGITIATLSKGILGLAMPGVVIFSWLMFESVLHRRLVIGDWLRPGLFTLLALIPLFVWLYFLYQQRGVEALEAVLWSNSVGRFSGSFVEAGHHEPFYYYLVKLTQAFLPWNLLVYLGLWHFRKQLFANRHLMFFSLWLVAQFLLLSLASSKRMVYLMSLMPAAAVIAAEYGCMLASRVRQRCIGKGNLASLFVNGKLPIAATVLLITMGYVGAALWLIPRADSALSFVPLTDKIHALQQEGRNVALFQPSERLAGASVFYSQTLLPTFTSELQLMAYLKAAPMNVAVMERSSQPLPPFAVMQRFQVGSRVYYFVSAAGAGGK